MAKFRRDLLEVCKDIGQGLYFVFKHTVWFMWDMKEAAVENSAKLVKKIKNIATAISELKIVRIRTF